MHLVHLVTVRVRVRVRVRVGVRGMVPYPNLNLNPNPNLAQLGVGAAALEGDALALGRVALDGGREGPRTDAPVPARLANRGEVVGVPSPSPDPNPTLDL